MKIILTGVTSTPTLVFNKSERAALRRASRIAEQARSRLISHYGSVSAVEAQADDIDLELAAVEHSCEAMAGETFWLYS
ncbi:hypothetical protein LCGC14_1905540 [marine sediment metagenome]|uniref:Uncharacterized protein n=1 Tax=marine sediment metagenome TaxID=412755 RepID=A0A0F9I973_9ZZZZ